MREPKQGPHRLRAPGGATAPGGLFRHLLAGPGRSVIDVFAELRREPRLELIAEHPERHSQAARFMLDRMDGHGSWEFYRLEQDLFVVTGDLVYDSPRIERVPGEGLVEFHLRLSGQLQIDLPGRSTALTVDCPSMLIWMQPPGQEITEQVRPGIRDSTVTLYCQPGYLRELMVRNGIRSWPLLDEIQSAGADRIWHRQMPLSAGLMYVGRSLLQNPFAGGIRLLHAEAKVLELLCELLHMLGVGQPDTAAARSDDELQRLDRARQILRTQLQPAPRIRDVARAVGMSESKLKRAFKARFGVTVFDYGLECRMRHALELLRCKHLSVGQVAYAVGYRHQTSFTAAFVDFFGFLPRQARTEMH